MRADARAPTVPGIRNGMEFWALAPSARPRSIALGSRSFAKLHRAAHRASRPSGNDHWAKATMAPVLCTG